MVLLLEYNIFVLFPPLAKTYDEQAWSHPYIDVFEIYAAFNAFRGLSIHWKWTNQERHNMKASQ